MIENNKVIDDFDDVMKLWDVINYKPSAKRVKNGHSTVVTVIHVFKGGVNSIQSGPFIEAVSIYDFDKISVEYMTVKDVKDRQWEPKNLVEWLLSSDVHFILCHVHQGLEPLHWNMLVLQQQLGRLHYHDGFPNGINLKCPAFTQDKYQYLKAAKSIVNNTLKIVLTANGIYENSFDKIRRYYILSIVLFLLLLIIIINNATYFSRFMMDNNEGCGWVLKTPFSTNKRNICWPKSFDDVISLLARKSHMLYGLIPYIMLQACMANKREYKVIVLDRIARYVSRNPSIQGRAFSIDPHEKLLEFATYAVNILSQNCPAFIADGLLRVDIFQTAKGNFVVNEFESLEASYWSSKTPTEEMATTRFCASIWRKELLKFISPA
jgi:hypothetical protein